MEATLPMAATKADVWPLPYALRMMIDRRVGRWRATETT